MGLFSLPPQKKQADVHFEDLLKADSATNYSAAAKRTLAPEWAPQSGVQLTWPHAQTDWLPTLDEVTATYLRMAYEIALREPLIIVHPDPEELASLLRQQLPQRALEYIRLIAADTNDTWARDHAFLSVTDTDGIELHDYGFNGWGGKFEATKDNAINRTVANSPFVRGTYVDHLDFILEGGSIETDGRGTLLTTSKCLLNKNRNPRLDRQTIETNLCQWLGIEKVLWLDYGHLEGDDTDAHIDTLARLCPQNQLVYVQCDNPVNPAYEEFQQMEAQLRTFRNADGEPYRLVPLPWPEKIVYDGEQLPATYANYLILNGAILLPTYNQPELDEKAAKVLASVFPTYDIIPIPSLSLIKQHGSVHCATMQYPKGVIKF
ncbi:MAG: agmatine deiminase family protein [Alloprevotella sp.]|nr:agmatine deiminase family protein [Alloprevotella sp.]